MLFLVMSEKGPDCVNAEFSNGLTIFLPLGTIKWLQIELETTHQLI